MKLISCTFTSTVVCTVYCYKLLYKESSVYYPLHFLSVSKTHIHKWNKWPHPLNHIQLVFLMISAEKRQRSLCIYTTPFGCNLNLLIPHFHNCGSSLGRLNTSPTAGLESVFEKETEKPMQASPVQEALPKHNDRAELITVEAVSAASLRHGKHMESSPRAEECRENQSQQH